MMHVTKLSCFCYEDAPVMTFVGGSGVERDVEGECKMYRPVLLVGRTFRVDLAASVCVIVVVATFLGLVVNGA